MGAVGGAEGIVHIHIRIGGQLPGEGFVVLFLFLVEAQVLQQGDLAFLQGGDHGIRVRPHHVLGHLHRLAQQLA